MRSRETQTADISRVLPLPIIERNVLLSGLLSLIPLFGVLIGLTVVSGAWPWVAAGEIATTGLLALAFWRYRLVHLTVSSESVVKRSFAVPRVEIPLDHIASVVLARIYRSNSTESYVLFVAFDDTGRRLFRLSGLFWSEGAMLDAAHDLDTIVTFDEQPVSLSCFFRANPAARFWYERRAFIVIGIVLSVVAVTSLLMLVESAIG